MHDIAWVDNQARSVQELQQEAADRGLPIHGNRNQLRARIRAHINAISTTYFNDNVAEVVDELRVGTNLTTLQEIANAYDISTTGKNFYQLRNDLQSKLSANPTDPAPAAIDKIMEEWAAAHPPPDDPEGWFFNMRSNPWILVGVCAVIALIYFTLIAPEKGWWPNEDDGANAPPTSSEVTPTSGLSNSPPATTTSRADGDNGEGNLPNGEKPTAGSPEVVHFARLESLDPAFRSGGWQNWLSAAGVKCETVRDARQPEEETSPSGKISVAGLQVEAKKCHVPWPNIVTTDVPSRVVSKDANSFEYKPDPNNGSVLYTNVTVTGPVTIWADGQNWGQFTGKLGFVSSPKTTVVKNGCFSLAELDSRYGIDRNAQGTSNGLLMDANAVAGAVLRLNADQISELEKLGWTIQGTNPTVKSAWSPVACRPLS